jgi:hypothetical protein
MITAESLEKYRKILKDAGHEVSDEELYEIANNIGQLADLILAFEKRKYENTKRKI